MQLLMPQLVMAVESVICPIYRVRGCLVMMLPDLKEFFHAAPNVSLTTSSRNVIALLFRLYVGIQAQLWSAWAALMSIPVPVGSYSAH